LWKEEPACSEEKLVELARSLAGELSGGDRVLLEGPMGAGKSTFARALIEALGVRQPPEGSPTFAIAHEYDSLAGGVVHIDFYRLRSETEIEEAGIPSYLWDRQAIVITEWLSLWAEFEAQVLNSGRNWSIQLAYRREGLRKVQVRLQS
jgi:tRNA threonylcarbamoyl adenosine modification protein YjeE